MKWIKLFEEYSDTTKIEKANTIFLTYQIMKELNAMELKKGENNRYIYFYTGAYKRFPPDYDVVVGSHGVKFVLKKGGDRFMILAPNTIAKKITAKFSPQTTSWMHFYNVDPFIGKVFLKCVHDFFANKYQFLISHIEIQHF